MKPNEEFKHAFAAKFWNVYPETLRALRKDAEWKITFYGSARFLRIAEGLKRATEAQDVLDKLGEDYIRSNDYVHFLPTEEHRKWSRTKNFVKEWYAEEDKRNERAHRELDRFFKREEAECEKERRLAKEARNFGKE